MVTPRITASFAPSLAGAPRTAWAWRFAKFALAKGPLFAEYQSSVGSSARSASASTRALGPSFDSDSAAMEKSACREGFKPDDGDTTLTPEDCRRFNILHAGKTP